MGGNNFNPLPGIESGAGFQAGNRFQHRWLGNVATARGQYEKALALIEKGLALRLSHGGRVAAIDDYINMAVVLTALKQDDAAHSYLLEALKLSLASSREALILETLMALAHLHARQNRPERAAKLARLTLCHPAAEYLSKERAKDLLNQTAEKAGVPIYDNFTVLPPDPHGFDGDNDGIGCET